MEIINIIDALEGFVEKSRPVPLTGKCMVDREELAELVRLLRAKLPEDIKQAKWVRDERQRIIQDAQKEAANIIKEAESKIAVFIDQHEITRQAEEKAAEIIATAKRTSREIRLGTNEYADNLMVKLEEYMREKLAEIKGFRDELK
jgi:cell division septum initiation protein DivIVA